MIIEIILPRRHPPQALVHTSLTPTLLLVAARSSGCSACDTAAKELRSVLPDLGLKTYQVEDGKGTAEFADRVPALVIFHGHTPVLYEGKLT